MSKSKSKSYLCKDCEHNNYGWCKKKKRQNLKSVTSCEYKGGKADIEAIFKTKYSHEAHKVLGKREMFLHVCLQILAMERKGKNSVSLDELKKILISTNEMLNVDETVHGVALDYLIDGDIVNSSKSIVEQWEEKLKGTAM